MLIYETTVHGANKDVFSGAEVLDIRFPTSRTLDGSDAMNPQPDYSAAYVVLRSGALSGHGFTFTIGRGNELCCAAIEALLPRLGGWSLDDVVADMGGFCRRLTGDCQLRWVGPEKGVVHLAAAAILNAVWDLWSKREGLPVWQLVAGLPPERFVSLLDLRGLADVLTPAQALEIRKRAVEGQEARAAALLAGGYPAYTTSAGWLGYDDAKIRMLCRAAVAEGWQALKIKVGGDAREDLRRCAIVREEIGPNRRLMIDANQVWETGEAIDRVRDLARFAPWWIEEPVHPDDVLGHADVRRGVAPVRVATGEHVPNRVVFKQLLRADAIDVVQFDNCRLGGLNEALAVLLLAARYGKPVCPHAGGVGLCQYAPHVSAIDYLCVSGSLDERMAEYTSHLHEHFVEPAAAPGGRYRLPARPGFGGEMLAASIRAHAYPHGSVWATHADNRRTPEPVALNG